MIKILGDIVHINRLWALLIIASGLCLLAGGFIYDVMFAGIPYQDPTPEMEANYAHHAAVASSIYWAGLECMLLGCVLVIIRRITQRWR
jgi:hypothetical protein